MRSLWGYSDFMGLLERYPGIRSGIVIDTNVLISATYDFDVYYEKTNELFDLIFEFGIPLYCNVNVRAEFLEAHRRIAFTEALLSFEEVVKKADLSLDLRKKLSSIRSNQKKREDTGRKPLRLGDADIKEFKAMMIRVESQKGNLWYVFCKEYVADQLSTIWQNAVDNFGLNFLSLRSEDLESFIDVPPSWEKTVEFMSSEGLSSSDAMIINMFQATNFELILSSDVDIGFSVKRMNRLGKICILPDQVKSKIEF